MFDIPRKAHIGNPPIARGSDRLNDAALVLMEPAQDSGEFAFRDAAAEAIARGVDGYPSFAQRFGEALRDAADVGAPRSVDAELEGTHPTLVRDEVFEPLYRAAGRADQDTARVAASLGAERFEKSQIDGVTRPTSSAIAQSLGPPIADNLIYGDDDGVYAYTAPLFGDFLRRRHPRLEEDV